jgi:diacylglycerol kinase family enzyme
MLIISNPNAGKKQGPDFIRQHVTWFIDEFLPPTIVPEVKETTKEGDAGDFALEYIKQNTGKDRITILVSGGDTTIHEIIQHVESSARTETRLPRVDIALLPMGTANALYYSEFPPEKAEDICKTFDPRVQRRLATLDKETRSNLLSLSALCSSLPSTPLTIARSSIYDARGTLSMSVFSIVVVSSCTSKTKMVNLILTPNPSFTRVNPP